MASGSISSSVYNKNKIKPVLVIRRPDLLTVWMRGACLVPLCHTHWSPVHSRLGHGSVQHGNLFSTSWEGNRWGLSLPTTKCHDGPPRYQESAQQYNSHDKRWEWRLQNDDLLLLTVASLKLNQSLDPNLDLFCLSPIVFITYIGFNIQMNSPTQIIMRLGNKSTLLTRVIMCNHKCMEW